MLYKKVKIGFVNFVSHSSAYRPDRCKFLRFSVKARLGKIADKEDFMHKILGLWVVLLPIIHYFVRFSSLVTLSTFPSLVLKTISEGTGNGKNSCLKT